MLFFLLMTKMLPQKAFSDRILLTEMVFLFTEDNCDPKFRLQTYWLHHVVGFLQCLPLCL